MKRRWLFALRATMTGFGAVAAALLAVFALTRSDQSRALDHALFDGLVRGTFAARSPANEPVSGEKRANQVPLFSEDWYDDSGFSYATMFSAPVTDPTSLDQLRTALEGRAKRGIDHLQATLDLVPPGSPDRRAHVTKLNMMIGSLLMYDGDFAAATRRFEAVLRDWPSGAEHSRANIEALIGVAAMRRGENENCVACRNESSCIFPLAPEAVHRRPSGSREAVRRFTAYLEERPEDIGVRWLLNVAYMTLGEYPDKVPARYLISLDSFRSGPDVGRFVNVAPRVGLDARGPNMAGGCIADDFDGDGRLDIFTSTSNPSSGASLFINRGDGSFEDRSVSAGLGPQVAALNCKQADFDNDGRLDVLLLRGGWERPRRLSLLRNTGGGVFADVTLASGLGSPIASQSGAWGDYDNDGWLDLYVAGEYDPERPDPQNHGRLYHNNRDGTFTDVAVEAGVQNDGFAKGADWGDYDDDGDLDLYVSNLGQLNRLYRNNGDGTFTDVARALGVSEPLHSFACWFWDYNNDGKLDIFVNPYAGRLTEIVRSHLRLPTSGDRPRLYRNDGAKGFRDVTVEAGLDRVLIPMGSNFGDIDNDGFIDMYLGTGRPPYMYIVPNVLFKNVGGVGFVDVTSSSGTGHLQKGHGVAMADWDQDGDVDIVLESGGATPGDKAGNVLFLNPGHGHHWVNIRLKGSTSNRSAIGARIRVQTTGPDGTPSTLHRVVTSGGSFGGNPLATTIGLGRATAIAALSVTWPTSRTEQRFHDVPLDRAIEVTEGQSWYRTLDWSPIPLPAPK